MATKRKTVSAAGMERNGTLAALTAPARLAKAPGAYAPEEIVDDDDDGNETDGKGLIDHCVETALGHGLTAQVCRVTPEMAREWLLALGEKQRGIKKAHYESITRDMRDGKFLFNAQPVIFDWDGKLIDGQHRLRAIVETATTQTLLVVRGLDPGRFANMDIVAKRQNSDALDGQHRVGVAAAALVLYKYQNGELTKNIKLSPSRVLEIVQAHPRLHLSATKANQNVARMCGSLGVAIFCHYIFASIDRDAADLFFDRIGSEVGLYDGSPILALRRRLAKGKYPKIMTLILIFKAWNAYRRLQSVKSLTVAKDEPLPEPI